ncbi:MAG: phosphotransferase enzyme family protein [Syntrophobacteraceae bacterium]
MSERPDHLDRAAQQFAASSAVAAITEHGSGNVHDTFLVTLDRPGRHRFILQRLNAHVFREPREVMGNILAVSEHIRKRLIGADLGGRRWEPFQVLRAFDGTDHWVAPDGSFWRALSFIEGARTFDTLQSPDHAREVGSALGLFHTLVSDLPCHELFDTLEGFHITPRYLDHFDEVLTVPPRAQSPEMDVALSFVQGRRHSASVLEDAKAAGVLMLRPVHGDPKVGNVMIDVETGHAVSIVDLDTVKPGLIQYDIGDCLRSGCNPAGELPDDLGEVRFDLELCRAILGGYLSVAGGSLSRNDVDFIYDSAQLISFELGLRFLTDHCEGDVYFRTRFPGQNLKRALVQFRLCESIESQKSAIRDLVRELAR